MAEESSDIWVYDLQHDALTRLTSGGGPWYSPIWSPDGRYIVVNSGGRGVFQARADGATPPEPLLESKGGRQAPWSFTPDGKWLAYYDYAAGRSQIWIVPMEEQGGRLKAGRPQQFLKSNFDQGLPSFSPDGRWVAYQSSESGQFEIYVRPFPQPSSGPGGRWQVSNNGGRGAQWASNGHDLIYRSGSQIMAVSYTVSGDAFMAGKPRVWIANSGIGEQGLWTLAPDGKRILTLTPSGSAPAKPEHDVVLLENFLDYLQQRVPTSK
jgi:serine/threonine-protein kinase